MNSAFFIPRRLGFLHEHTQRLLHEHTMASAPSDKNVSARQVFETLGLHRVAGTTDPRTIINSAALCNELDFFQGTAHELHKEGKDQVCCNHFY